MYVLEIFLKMFHVFETNLIYVVSVLVIYIIIQYCMWMYLKQI